MNTLRCFFLSIGCIIAGAMFSGCSTTPVRTVDSIKINQFSDPRIWSFEWEKNTGGKFIAPTRDGSAGTAPVAVSQEELEEFSELVSDNHFFEMEKNYGELVPNGGELSVTISMGEISKTVTLRYLGNWEQENDRQKLDAPSRVFEIIDKAISWTGDEEIKKIIHAENMRLRDKSLRNPMLFHTPRIHNW